MERKLSWENPTAYTDGTVLGPAEAARIKVHVFRDGSEVYVTLPGVTEWPIEVGNPGTTSTWELAAELDGQVSAIIHSLAYTEPFLKPMPPKNPGIQ